MNDVRIVVPTLDLYKDVWEGLIHGLKRYWPHCPFPVTFITNKLDAPYGETIKVGGDHTNWGGRMRRGLKKIKEPLLLWSLCDHWLTAPPDVDTLMDFADLVRRGKIDRLRLYPGTDHDFGRTYKRDNRLIIMDKKSPYRCSCKPSLWRKDVLFDLLHDGESPWDFERRGRGRSGKYTFAMTKNWHWFFVTQGCPDGENWRKSPCVKGRWAVSARRYAKREGLKIDFGRHPVKKSPFKKNDTPPYVLP